MRRELERDVRLGHANRAIITPRTWGVESTLEMDSVVMLE